MSKSNPFILPIIILVSGMFATIHISNLRIIRNNYIQTLKKTETHIEEVLEKNNRLNMILNTNLRTDDIRFIYQYRYKIAPKDTNILWYKELDHQE